MSADEKMIAAPGGAGRIVCFIDGPEAGRARRVPESEGNTLHSEKGYVYRVWPISMPGDSRVCHFAFNAQEHPLKMFFKMWEEYSIAAQIRGGSYDTHIKRLGDKDIKTRS
jgi:hypothetical protein